MTRLKSFLVFAVSVALLAACVPIPPLEEPPAQVAAVVIVETPTEPAPPTPEVTATLAPTATTAPTATLVPTAVATLAPTHTAAPTATLAPTRTSTAVPTLAPTRSRTPRPTSTRQVSAAQVLATRTPTRIPTRTAVPTPTVDKHLVIITEEDIAEAIAGGKAAEQGIAAQNLKVDLANGKMRVTADRLGYGLLNLQNLDMTGRLVANNGVLSLVVESITPRGLAANLVPTVANQALAQFGAKWYVEEVKTLDGRLELRVR